MPELFTNLDAEFLQSLSRSFAAESDEDSSLIATRLLSIARNLQSMDDRQGSEYARGFQDGKNSHIARSNVAKPLVPVFPSLREALESFKGEVHKLPPEKKKEGMKETLTIEDLDF